ncbi:hypothetical protein ONZ45_g6798 [Pleurotus djamor]|nr:hypothetical protein ONZ45_g6798 [Pleurotus djamor]
MICDHQGRSSDGEVVWWVSLYKYCTGAHPTDPDFAKKGGAIVLIFVHHGYLYTFDNDWSFQQFSIAYDRKNARHLRTLPMSYSGSEATNKAQAQDINFETDLVLHKNRGNETFVFPAQFRESFFRAPQTQATGFEVENGAMFGIKKEPSVKLDVSHAPVRGLNVLKCYDPTQTLKIEFIHRTVNSASGTEKNKLSRSFDIKLSEF